MIIDAHFHVGDFRGPGLEGRVPMTWENQLRRLDEEGIDRAIFLPVYNASPEGAPLPMIYREGHGLREQILAARSHADRIIPFGNMDPRWGTNSPETDFFPLLDWFQEMGCRGVGEVTANIPFDDERNVNMFRQLGERGLLVTVESCGFGPGHYGYQDEPGLPHLERLLELCPKTIVIGHGPGFWANIAPVAAPEDMNRYPKGPVAEGGAVLRLLRQFPNLYADLSAGSGWNALTRDRAFGIRFLVEFQDKLLFGTDVCFADAQGRMPQLGYLKALLQEGQLPAAAYEKIVAGNACRLLGL